MARSRRGAEREQLGRLVDEARVGLARPERRVREHVLQEREVGLHAADAELAQRAQALLDAPSKLGRAGGDLHQQRVVEAARCARRRSRCPPSSRMPKPAAGAVGEDLARVGQEVVRRVLGGDAALDRRAARLDGGLVGMPISGSESAYPSAMRICACTRSMPVICSVTVCSTWMRGVDLDEVERPSPVDQELDRAGVAVLGGAHQRERGVDRCARARRVGEVRAGANSMTFWWRRCTEQSRS